MDISSKSPVLPVAKKNTERSDSTKKTFREELATKRELARTNEKPKDRREVKGRAKDNVDRTKENLSRSNADKVDTPAKEAAGDIKSRLELRQQRSEGLRPLKLAANKSGNMVQDVPVIAFLKGQLEKLDPKDIPSLISTNQFIAGALQEGDIESYLNKEMPVDEILEALTVPNSVVQESISAGLDLKQVVTPADMLRSLGIDPSRVQSELINLRDNLQSKGVSGYMQKAAMLKGLQPNQNQVQEQNVASPLQNIPSGEIPTVKNPFALTSQIAANPLGDKLSRQPQNNQSQNSEPVQPSAVNGNNSSKIEMGTKGLAKAITVPVPSDLG